MVSILKAQTAQATTVIEVAILYSDFFYVHWCFACIYAYVRVSDLGVTDSVLGIEPGSSGRTANALNH